MPEDTSPDYYVFIDESGCKEYRTPYSVESVTNPSQLGREFWLQNYFVVAALIVAREHISRINAVMVRLKRETFGEPTVEVKSDWLRNPHQRRARYLDRYAIDESTLNKFGERILNLFPAFKREIKVIACIYDKRYYKNRTDNDPCCNTCQVVLERIEFCMRAKHSRCILVVDQMESSLSPERGRNGEIKDVLLNRRKMPRTFVEQYVHISDTGFRESKHENLLQLADIAAYNVFRQFVDNGREWEDTTKTVLNIYPPFGLLSDNFVTRNGQIRGVGICKLPDTAKINWVPRKE